MSLSDTLVSMLSMAIPIVAILGAFTVAIVSTYIHYRRQRELLQLQHAERMAALEKGIELPPLSPQLLGAGWGCSCRRGRSSGIVTLLVGVALTFALWTNGGGWWGLIVVAVGLGKVIETALGLRATQRRGAANPPGFPSDPGPGPGPSEPR
ncbi:MAG: hypothetical protein ACP5P4_07200 [Steroidobacteraceae bacterium]